MSSPDSTDIVSNSPQHPRTPVNDCKRSTANFRLQTGRVSENSSPNSKFGEKYNTQRDNEYAISRSPLSTCQRRTCRNERNIDFIIKEKEIELSKLQLQIEKAKSKFEETVKASLEHDEVSVEEEKLTRRQSNLEILKLENDENDRKREHESFMTKLKYDHELAMKKLTFDGDNQTGNDPETARFQLENEHMRLQLEIKKEDNLKLRLQNQTEERRREHELAMNRPENQTAVDARRNHELEMARLQNDHEIAMKNKVLKILQEKHGIEAEKFRRSTDQIQENCHARKHREHMAKLKKDILQLEVAQRTATAEAENQLRIKAAEAERRCRDDTENNRRQHQQIREHNEQMLCNVAIAGTGSPVLCEAIVGALRRVTSVGAVVGAAVVIGSGVAWAYSKTRSTACP